MPAGCPDQSQGLGRPAAHVLAAPGSTPVPWAKSLVGQWHVKVLINATSSDPNLTALRADILARGGSVFYNFLSVRALSATGAGRTALDALAARSDVIGISPNRSTTRHASLLQAATGSRHAAAADAPAARACGPGRPRRGHRHARLGHRLPPPPHLGRLRQHAACAPPWTSSR